MRKREAEPNIFIVPIESIEISETSRDDVPAVLRGLRHLYTQDELFEEVMTLLESHVAPDCDHGNGRPGMTLWNMLVLATMKQGLAIDYDRLEDMANQHLTLRMMLQQPEKDGFKYSARYLKSNVDLLTPEVLRKVSDIVVREGLKVAGKRPGDALAGRADSHTVETNVHYPTDVNLLWDATRVAVRDGSRLAQEHGLADWRQSRHQLRVGKRLFNRISRQHLWSKRPNEVKAYLNWSAEMTTRMSMTMAVLPDDASEKHRDDVLKMVSKAITLQDQVRRRILEGETIPHEEKMFSVFEEHTRWISKGKAGQPVELGVPLSILEEASGFVLGWRLHWEDGDREAAVPLVADVKSSFPDLESCSFDRGYHSPENQEALLKHLKRVVMPVPGKGTVASREREATDEFQAARKKHPGIESAINALESKGLDRVRLRGKDGFERAVAISILACNLHRLGRLLQKKAQAKSRRQRKRLAQAA